MFRYIRLLIFLACVETCAAPSSVFAQTETTLPSTDPDYGICPSPVGFTVSQEAYPGGPYNGQASITAYLIGYARYSFSKVRSQDGMHAIDGFFYIDYIQCRFRPFGIFIVEFPTVTKLYSLPTACSASQFMFANFDPYDQAGAGNCSGSGGWADGASGGGGPDCVTTYVIIEVSYDGGATWSTYWEGYANVCS